MNNTVLEMYDIHKHFGGIHALAGVDFELCEGEIHALLGENGAGKSTLVKIITGVHKADSGTIMLGGVPSTIENPVDARRKGIGVIYQELSLIESITVGENIFLGNEQQFLSHGLYDRKALYEKSTEYLEKFDIAIDPCLKVSDLRMGQKRIVEIIKALALDAKILLLDEPTTGMTQKEIDTLFVILDLLRKRKVTMIYISHYLDEVFQICDRATVFRDGQNVDTFTIGSVTQKELVTAMIGHEVKQREKREVRQFANVPILYELKEYQTSLMKHPLSFQVHAGEILGITGIIGAGKSELAHSMFGGGTYLAGSTLLRGQPMQIHSSISAKKYGIGFIPEDRKLEGLFLNSTISENLMIPNMDKSLNRFGLLDKQHINSFSMEMGKKLGIQPLNIAMLAGNLSGGNQQKVVIGKWLIGDPDIIIMDEPTRGIDIGAKSEIYNQVKQLAESGKAIIILSSEFQELIDLCDNILVLRAGSLAGAFTANEATGEKILSLSLGVQENGTENT